jgi:hypothetical protein
MRSDTDERLAAFIDELCTKAGGIWADPPVSDVRAMLDRHGLMVAVVGTFNVLDIALNNPLSGDSI